MIGRFGAALVAVAAAALAVWLAAHHPLFPTAALLAAAGLAALVFIWPRRWPLWLLPLIPWIGLMPWTGWLVVEELDIVVLAMAAGAWMHLAVRPWGASAPKPGAAWLWLLPLAVFTLVSMARGFSDAGGLTWGWWQGYAEPLNSLRLAKPVFAVLLLWPLWGVGLRGGSEQPWADGAVWVLLGVALAVVVERMAFTDLLNFSSDYRATGLFWEMHVGGAALDAVLALTLPFAVAGLARARTPLRWGVAAVVLALGAYAALATFSRIVYLAVPLAVGTWVVLQSVNRPRGGDAASVAGYLGLAFAAWTAYAALAAWCFGSSGYRGQLTLAAAAGLVLPLARVLRGLTVAEWRRGAIAGVGVALLVGGVAWAVPKGAYFAFGICWLLAMGCVVRASMGAARPPGRLGEGALACFLGSAAALVAVGVVWSEGTAWPASVAAATVLVVLAAMAGRARTPAWPESWRWQGQLWGALVVTSLVIGVFGGGAYMGNRLADTTQDSQGRLGHWTRALGLLKDGDWIFGKGLGRYYANHTLTGVELDLAGDYRLLPPRLGQTGAALVLTSGKHTQGFGEIFRVSQRVAAPAPGTVMLHLRVRTEQSVTLHAEICEKQLLYTDRCLGKEHSVKATGGAWQALQLPLTGEALSHGRWYAPRPIAFSIGLESRGSRAEIDDLQLIDSQGRQLLHNGDFEQGLARWFFSSDRHHLPWHAKNLVVHVVFEQGLTGLAALALAMGAALWRVTCGSARRHPLAPALAAAIVGLFVVGFVDSLFDMPRVAFLTLLMLSVALALPRQHDTHGPLRGPMTPPRA